MTKKEKLLTENKELFWDVNIKKIDDLAIEERFLKYGDWKNIQNLIKIYTLEGFKKNYILLRDKKRSNLSKKTINFFNLYLNV